MSMSELDLGRLLKSFCDKNGVPLGKEINLLKLLADVGGVAEELFTKNSKVSASIKAITGEDSMMVCPNCGSHVIIEYKTCIACGEELFEGAGQVQAPKGSLEPVKETESKEVEYPTVAQINKMKKPELEEWVNLLELDVDMDGKLKDIRDAIKEEIKDLKNPAPVKVSEEEVVEEDTLDDLDGEFEDEEDEEEELEDFEEDEDLEEPEEDEELEDEIEEEDDEEELEDDEEELEDDDLEEELEDEELDDEDLEEDFEDEEELEDDEEELDDEFEEELEEDEEELDDDFEEELDDDFDDEEELDDEFEEEIEEPAPKKTTKKKVAKKASKKVAKKVTKKAPAKKLSDKKAEREAKRASLRKKIPSLVKNPALLAKLEHSERVSLQTMLGEEQGNKKSLAELKGDAMIKQLKVQLAKWKKQNAKK
jgi:predicted RNA-binding Zn-ribbon protein involved in translation (DUF1610 family)